MIFADDHEQSLMQEDGSEKKEMINEVSTLHETITKGRCPKGLWLGGLKYKTVNYDPDFESGDATYVCIFASRSKAGVHICSTGKQVIFGLYSEEKEQTSGNAKRVVLAAAEYLKSM